MEGNTTDPGKEICRLSTKFPELLKIKIVAGLKGTPLSLTKQTAIDMANEVDLGDNLHAQSMALSGGQKRKLSLGIALISDSKVCFFLFSKTSSNSFHIDRLFG